MPTQRKQSTAKMMTTPSFGTAVRVAREQEAQRAASSRISTTVADDDELLVATRTGSAKSVEQTLAAKSFDRASKQAAIEEAARYDYVQILIVLLGSVPAKQVDFDEVIRVAAKNRSSGSIARLIQSGLDPQRVVALVQHHSAPPRRPPAH